MSPALVDRLMTKRNDVSVKLDSDVVAEANMMAASRELTLAGYLSEILRPIVHQHLKEETARRLKPGQPKARKPKGGE